MLWFLVVLVPVVIILLARLLYLKYAIKNVTEQLKNINTNRSDNRVVTELLSKDFEELTKAINDNIEIRKQCEASRIRTENALKTAIADMSHDLRTPLTSIIGYLQFMKLDNVTEEEKEEYVEVAYQRAKVLENLLNDFYTLSLIDSAEYEIDLEKIDLPKLLREILVERYNEFTLSNLTMNFKIPENSVYIIGDKKSVCRVIENLLANVIKYAKDKVEIVVEEADASVILKVGNNTNNLGLEDIDRLFDRFYMADKTRAGKGTGLGLAIAKSLIEKMGGAIKVNMTGDVFSMYCEFKKFKN